MHRHRPPSLSVLIADDDGAVRDCVVDLLAQWDFDVYTASTGEGALKVLLCSDIDFSILDVEMPELSGIEVLRRYRQGPWIAAPSGLPVRVTRVRRMPTIFMSGNPSADIRRACRAEGASFLDKPFEASQMRTAVNRVVDLLST